MQLTYYSLKFDLTPYLALKTPNWSRPSHLKAIDKQNLYGIKFGVVEWEVPSHAIFHLSSHEGRKFGQEFVAWKMDLIGAHRHVC